MPVEPNSDIVKEKDILNVHELQCNTYWLSYFLLSFVHGGPFLSTFS